MAFLSFDGFFVEIDISVSIPYILFLLKRCFQKIRILVVETRRIFSLTQSRTRNSYPHYKKRPMNYEVRKWQTVISEIRGISQGYILKDKKRSTHAEAVFLYILYIVWVFHWIRGVFFQNTHEKYHGNWLRGVFKTPRNKKSGVFRSKTPWTFKSSVLFLVGVFKKNTHEKHPYFMI